MSSYVPARGDLVWLDFSPQVGVEQAGRRPALVLSDQDYNERRRLAVVCPITSKRKGYYFEVPINSGVIEGAVLADQVKSIDWTMRDLGAIGMAPDEVVESVLDKIADLLSM
ncbi:MAG TPA: type II toxin-antitoxin system PemK/MazF family toxin [Fimbriimonas sp.]|nr:type II toxin-antitoxin system PemK/MazF family toxin [Fimbriimonas sp.]